MPIFGVIKHDKGVYLVNESVFVFGDETLIDEHNLLTFAPKGTHHTFISVRPDPYLAQIINDIDNLLPKDIDHNFNKSYLLHEFIPKINQQFLNLGLLKKGKITEGKVSLAIAHNDRVYYMGEACTMREIDEIEFFNLSDPFMKAAFDEIESDDPLFKLQIAAAVYDDKIAPVHFPIYVGDTYSEKIIIFTRKQCFDTYYEYIKGGKK